MKKLPKVIGVVLNYNGIGIVEEALDSLKLQTYKNLEIVVADDGSTNGDPEIIQKKYPWLKVIVNPKNSGTAGVSNYAAKTIGDCEYIVFMSNDMCFDKNSIKELVQTMEIDKKVGICTSVLVKHDPDPVTNKYYIDNAGIDMDPFGFIYPHLTNLGYAEISKDTEEVFGSCGGSFIISKKIFEKVNGFDLSYWSLSEDLDLSWRVRLLGYKVCVNKKSFLYHHIHKTLKTLKMSRTRYLSERNNLTSILKNYSAVTLLFILPVYTLLEFGEIIFFLLKRRPDVSKAILDAIIYNIKNIKTTLIKRRIIQSSRKVSDLEILKHMYHGSYKLAALPSLIRTNLH